MKELTLEWMRLAENDFSVAEQIFRSNIKSPTEIICFHCQQCIEKYLKALLTEKDIEFEKTHVLDRLLNLLLPIFPDLELHRAALNKLTNYASDTRYPGEFLVTRSMASDALVLVGELREILRLHIS